MPAKLIQPRDHLRQLLRNSIAKRNDCQKAVETAEAALKRAQSLARDKESPASRNTNKSKTRVSDHRALSDCAWASSGGMQPRLTLPPDLIEALRERDQYQADLEAAKSAVQSLAVDLDTAKAALSKVERKVQQSAAAVCVELARLEAELLRECQQEVWQHSASIRAMARLFVPADDGAMRAVSLPREALDSLDREPPQAPPALDPTTLAAAHWRSFHARLTQDHNASFQEETTNAKAVA